MCLLSDFKKNHCSSAKSRQIFTGSPKIHIFVLPGLSFYHLLQESLRNVNNIILLTCDEFKGAYFLKQELIQFIKKNILCMHTHPPINVAVEILNYTEKKNVKN